MRTGTRWGLWPLAALVATSCTSFAPMKVNVGDQCFRCRRTIAEPRIAGEMIDRNGFVTKFRTSGCMAKYLADYPDETGTVFVTDYTSGKMVTPDAAFFVPVVLNRQTGERDYYAYRIKAHADAAALEAHTVPVGWKTVIEKARS